MRKSAKFKFFSARANNLTFVKVTLKYDIEFLMLLIGLLKVTNKATQMKFYLLLCRLSLQVRDELTFSQKEITVVQLILKLVALRQIEQYGV